MYIIHRIYIFTPFFQSVGTNIRTLFRRVGTNVCIFFTCYSRVGTYIRPNFDIIIDLFNAQSTIRDRRLQVI